MLIIGEIRIVRERERELDKKPSLVGIQFFYRMHICPGCQRTWKRVCLGPLSA